jgi:hypothetical protein
MADEIVVKAVIIHIEGEDRTLSIAEAKKLHEALCELFRDTAVISYWPYYTAPFPYRYWRASDSNTDGCYTLRLCDEPQPTETIGGTP